MTASKPTEKADGQTDITDMIHGKTDILHDKRKRRRELNGDKSYFKLNNKFLEIHCSFLESSS
jgi:hypothetical protein